MFSIWLSYLAKWKPDEANVDSASDQPNDSVNLNDSTSSKTDVLEAIELVRIVAPFQSYLSALAFQRCHGNDRYSFWATDEANIFVRFKWNMCCS